MNLKRQIPELTGIRFIAATHIILFHIKYMLGDSVYLFPKTLRSILYFGDSAVALFFILSGFVLTYVYHDINFDKDFSKKKFWLKRIVRIYPLYLLAFFMDMPRVINYFYEHYDQNVAFYKTITSGIAYVFGVQAWHHRLSPVWNSPAWAVSCELFFYFVFPFILPFIIKRKSSLKFLILFYVIPIVLYFVLENYVGIDFKDRGVATLWKSFPLINIFQFLIGIFLAKIYLNNHKLKEWLQNKQAVSSILFWFSCFLSFFLVSFKSTYPRMIFTSTFLVPLFSLMIFLLASTRIAFTRFLRSKIFIFMGTASYAIYITHIPVYLYIRSTLLHFELPFGVKYFLITFLLLLLLPVLFFIWIEKPLNNYFLKKI